MEEKRANNKKSPVDIAYEILKAEGQEKSFREIIQQVFETLGIPLDNHQMMASIHTQINMDNRFHFLGQGKWGLKEWTQDKVIRRSMTNGPGSRGYTVRRRTIHDEVDGDGDGDGDDKDSDEDSDNSSFLEDDDWEE